MATKKIRVSSGVGQLDNMLGGIFIGDNVVWYDDAGSVASIFSFNFIRESLQKSKPLIYVSFDRSPKTILNDLGPLAESRHLTILDCFTHGKGDGSEVFAKFYQKDGAQWPYQIIMVTEPWKPEMVSESIYSLHQTMKGDVRFVFETLTGMQDLWDGEDAILKFYSRSCPRLYELDTIAYWIMEKGAHSDRLKAHINQIAQVAIDLSAKRGKSTLTVLKAHKRRPDSLNTPVWFWHDDMEVVFESEGRQFGKYDLGLRIKELRKRQSLSQKELAGMVGVTPSTISQIESNSIYPSLPALLKIAQTLNVEAASFFKGESDVVRRTVFSGPGTKVDFPDLIKDSLSGTRLLPADFDARMDTYLIEIPSGSTLSSHFFFHKGEEMGYVLSGHLQMIVKNTVYDVQAGDVIYLLVDMPSQWKNTGEGPCQMLWCKIR